MRSYSCTRGKFLPLDFASDPSWIPITSDSLLETQLDHNSSLTAEVNVKPLSLYKESTSFFWSSNSTQIEVLLSETRSTHKYTQLLIISSTLSFYDRFSQNDIPTTNGERTNRTVNLRTRKKQLNLEIKNSQIRRTGLGEQVLEQVSEVKCF